MNSLKKIWCRTFQTAFRIVLPILPYRKPEILPDASAVPGVLKKRGVRRVMLVTDKTIRRLGLTAPLEQFLSEAGIDCAVYDQTVANPTTTNAEEARALYLAEKCQAMIAFGGGSPMDCAKAAGARIARPHTSLYQMKGILKVIKPIPFLIAIPTTAGTGSETTLAALVTDPATQHKYTINDFPLIPRCAVLDASVTASLPPLIAATTGMDALTHAVEAYIGRSTTGETRAYALEAVRLIFRYIDKAWQGGDEEARHEMLKAAYLAGNAFTRSYVGYVHAIAHSLGGRYNTPHGLANAVLLPVLLEAYKEKIYGKLHRLAVAAGVSTPSASDQEGAEAFILALKAMQNRLGIPNTLSEIKAKDVPEMSRRADKEANPLYPVPVLYDARELEKFYFAVMEKEA